MVEQNQACKNPAKTCSMEKNFRQTAAGIFVPMDKKNGKLAKHQIQNQACPEEICEKVFQRFRGRFL